MDKREEILRVSSKMFFEKGFDRTSMRDLAEATHLTTAGLYYYIKSKRRLLAEVDQFLMNEFEKKVFLTPQWEKDPERRIRQFIGNVIGLVLDAPEMHSMMMEKAFLRGEIKRVSRPKRKELVKKTEAFLTQLRKDGEVAEDIDDEIDMTVATFSLIAIVNWISLWFDPEGRISKQQLIDSVSKLFMKFFFKEKKESPLKRRC
jgi:AcrR family transcriptional regulator